MKSENKQLEAYKELAQNVGSVGRSVQLSRKQKKAMLQSILPKRSLFARLHPVPMSFALVLLLISSSLIAVSQPGNPLYAVKRGIEDVRSKVQPSYDEKLLKRRDEEINNLKKNGGDEDALQTAESEKKEIEDRVKSRDGGVDTQEAEQQDTQESSQPKQESSHTESTDDHHEQTQQTTTQRSTRDICRDALDARKRSGENINSDAYKACDNL
jgi:hypothetical protein